MNIVRAGFYTSLATAARLLAGLVAIKLVAWFAGPEGVGRLGQFMSLMSLLAVLAGGGISAAIVKYVAEYRDDPPRLSRLLSAALCYAFCASCLMGGAALLLSRQLAAWLLGDPGYAGLIRVLAVAQLGIALLNYILAVVNGFMDVRRLALIQAGGALVGIVMMIWLARWLHLYGALLALVLGQLLWLAIALPAWWRSSYFRRRMLRLHYDREMTLRLATFSVMTLTSALLPPLVNIAVRDHLALQFGWERVGYWQAVSKVSDAYLLFFTAAINIYYLPKLASTHGREALLAELRSAGRHVLPAVIVLAAMVYALRGWVTRLLFTPEFAAANALYGPQLVGDVIKVASFVLSYLMLAKAMTALFVVSECVFAASYLALVWVFAARYGLVGAMYAFAVNYLLYLAFNLLVARRYLGGLRR
ncbi:MULTISPECIES: O-antigen translocase [Rhodanobacter]|uniref:O-antigen translocase n=1 Tax=Rhodanobacter TaxID=75309 RepID=UPI00026106D1|nr:MULTISPECIES: O-antigen translocase [Rhodanobacter]EIM02651.1 lipopolysaccharide biosynthesis protein [Rhodanobacter denitrificans]KZC21479.1 lipopolysaccharide biosynthesis protein [Rhodanobacter denitrificans]UJJ59487.1 O-antigen translocase [Rhodanobacter denitrificans]UJM89952.1 O-antigen translocase [Rhodanobacter denitrificans]UJM94481.1 O-antigen translocase [Rhodanobacter denitrificans]